MTYNRESELARQYALWKGWQITDKELITAVGAFFAPKISQAEIEAREAAIRQWHIERGCCNGNPSEACIGRQEPPKRGRQKEPNEFEGTE